MTEPLTIFGSLAHDQFYNVSVADVGSSDSPLAYYSYKRWVDKDNKDFASDEAMYAVTKLNGDSFIQIQSDNVRNHTHELCVAGPD